MAGPGDDRLIADVKQEAGIRLILPFGLNVHLGDVVSVDRYGGLTLQGRSQGVLGISDITPRPPQPPGDLVRSSKEGVSFTFHAVGKASTFYPQLPSLQASIDIRLERADSWLMALIGRRLDTLEDVDRFRQPILSSYKHKVWQPDWALVIEVATAERMTFLAARKASTEVTVVCGASVLPQAGDALKLTANTSVARTSEGITQWIEPSPSSVGIRALCVNDRWWRKDRIGTLEFTSEEMEALKAPAEQFWKDL